MQAFEDEATSDLLETQGFALEKEDRIIEAIQHYKRAYAARERLLGVSAPKTIKSGIDLARCLARSGHHREALPYCEKVLQWMKANPSQVQSYTVNRVKTLHGDILRGLGLFPDSVAAYQEVLSSTTDKESRNITLNGLAGVYREIGKYKEALDCYWESYNASKDLHGEESTQSLTILNNIATAMLEGGDAPEKVLEMFEKVYNGYLKLCGEAHPNTVKTASNISNVMQKLGRYQDAEKWGKDALRISERLFGEENQPTLSIANGLGTILNKLEKYDEAEDVLSVCVEGLAKAYGPDNSMTLITRSNLAQAIRGKGDLPKALSEQKSVYAGMEKAFGPGHVNSRSILQEVISLQEEMGLYADAIKNQEQLLVEMLKHGPPHRGHVKCLEHMAIIYRKAGQGAKAKETEERASRMLRDIESRRT